jgi:starch synthase
VTRRATAAAARRPSPPAESLRVVMVSMEMMPLVKVGGLADMVGSLARVLAARGHDVTVILPAYPHLLISSDLVSPGHAELELPHGGTIRRARFHRLDADGVRVFLLEDPLFSRREGVYVDPATREEYPDSADRFAVLARGALEILLRADLPPDVLHVHDYQAALVPVLLRRGGVAPRFFRGAATMLTIHNMGHQGVYPPDVLGRIGLDPAGFHPGGPLEFWGQVNYLKAGILDADRITTVSPHYAEEIRTPEFGWGLEGVLAGRGEDVSGIVNGIDTATWDPATDALLAAPYDADRLEEKARNKRWLLERLGLLVDPGCPVVGMISRLVEQKGIDLVIEAADRLLARDLTLVVLGSGRPAYEDFFRSLAAAHPDRVSYSHDFDDPLAHAIEGGADIFLMPSRYEPCGLNQMMSLRYGTVPVVRRVGGLADTVRPVEEDPVHGTGFAFDGYTPEDMLAAVDRALAAWTDRSRWTELQRRGMAEDVSWDRSADRYEAVYREARAGARWGRSVSPC